MIFFAVLSMTDLTKDLFRPDFAYREPDHAAQKNRGREGKGNIFLPITRSPREGFWLHFLQTRKEGADQNSGECIVAKNRHGEARTVKMHWQGEFMRFTGTEDRSE